MKRTWLFPALALVAITGCSISGNVGDEATATTQRLVRELIGAWQSGDDGQIDRIFAEDATYDDVPNGHTYEGRKGARDYIGHVHDWATDLNIEVVKVHVSATSGAVEWIMRGIQARPLGDRFPLATGKAFELRGVTLIEVEDGEITRAADYMDVASFLAQLGTRFTLPEE